MGIICAYLVKLGRRDALPRSSSVRRARGGSVAGHRRRRRRHHRAADHRLQATLEGLAAVAAVVVVTRMLFWMRRQGRAIKGELESQVSLALAQGSTAALIGIVFIAVIREGLEMTLFFLAIIASAVGRRHGRGHRRPPRPRRGHRAGLGDLRGRHAASTWVASSR